MPWARGSTYSGSSYPGLKRKFIFQFREKIRNFVYFDEILRTFVVVKIVQHFYTKIIKIKNKGSLFSQVAYKFCFSQKLAYHKFFRTLAETEKAPFSPWWKNCSCAVESEAELRKFCSCPLWKGGSAATSVFKNRQNGRYGPERWLFSCKMHLFSVHTISWFSMKEIAVQESKRYDRHKYLDYNTSHHLSSPL